MYGGKTNRSVPEATVIPVLAYEDVVQGSEWLCNAFGFVERLRIGTHRVQLMVGDGAVILSKRSDGSTTSAPGNFNHSLLVRVEDVDQHYQQAKGYGAQILQPPTDFPYGERQYNVADIGGHHWTFSQSIADVDPQEWGATLPADHP